MKKSTIFRSKFLSTSADKFWNSKIFNYYFLKAMAAKIFLSAVVCFGLFSFASAQNTQNNNAQLTSNRDISHKLKDQNREEKREVRAVENISSATMSLFAIDFPKAKNVSWMSTEGYTEADYNMGKSQMMAFFDFDNKLIGTAKYVDYNTLPAVALKDIAKHFKGFVAKQVLFYDDNEANETNIDMFNQSIDQDAYFALMDRGNKEIVLQILPDGEVAYFDSVK